MGWPQQRHGQLQPSTSQASDPSVVLGDLQISSPAVDKRHIAWNLPAHEPSVSCWIPAWSLVAGLGSPGRVLTVRCCLRSLLLSRQATTSPEDAEAISHFRALLFLPAQNQQAAGRDANSHWVYRCSPAEPAARECRADQPRHEGTAEPTKPPAWRMGTASALCDHILLVCPSF